MMQRSPYREDPSFSNNINSFEPNFSEQYPHPYRYLTSPREEISKDRGESLRYSRSPLPNDEIQNLSLMINSKDTLLAKCRDTIEDLNKEIEKEKDFKQKMTSDYHNLQESLDQKVAKISHQLREKESLIQAQGDELLDLKSKNGSFQAKIKLLEQEMKDYDSAEKDRQELRNNLYVIDEERNELLNQNKELISLMDEKEQKIREMNLIIKANEDNISILNADIERSKEKLQNESAHSDQLHHKIKSLENENREFYKELQKNSLSKDELQRSMDEKLKQTEMKLTLADKKIAKMEDEFAHQMREKDKAHQIELDDAYFDVKKYTREVEILREELHFEKQKFEQQLKEMYQVQTDRATEIYSLKETLTSRKEEIQVHDSQYEKERNDLITKIGKLEKEIYDTNYANSKLEYDVKLKQNEIDQLRKNSENTVRKEEELYQTSKRNSNEIIQLQYLNQQYKSDLELLSKKTKEIQEDAELLKADRERLLSQINDLKKELVNAEKLNNQHLANIQAIKTECMREIDKYTTQLHSHKMKINKEKELRRNANNTVEELNRKVVELESKYVKELNHYKEELLKKEESLRIKTSRYDKKLAISNTVHVENLKKTDKLEKQLHMLRSWISDLERGDALSGNPNKNSLTYIKNLINEIGEDIQRMIKINQSII